MLEDEYYGALSYFNIVDRRLVKSCLDFEDAAHVGNNNCDICRYEKCNKQTWTYSLENEYLTKEHVGKFLFKTCDCRRCLLNRLLFKLLMNKSTYSFRSNVNWQNFVLNVLFKINTNYKFIQLAQIIITFLKHKWLFVTASCRCVTKAVTLLKRALACDSRIRFYKRLVINANRWLTLWILKACFRHSSNKASMIEAGKLGLLISVNRFDFGSGYKFSTYAKWWVKHKMYKTLTLRKETQTFKTKVLKRHVFESRQNVLNYGDFATGGGYVLSLDKAIGENYNLHAITAYDDRASKAEHYSNLIQAFNTMIKLVLLAPKEERILRLRGHILCRREWSLAKIGREMGLSRERVRQVEASCIFKMRTFTKNFIKDYFTK
ncbi:MAG: sigma-70 family RNA polymerase sigma factor [Candidatus Hodgkinia cicadicola]